jgi:hypothetical protein
LIKEADFIIPNAYDNAKMHGSIIRKIGKTRYILTSYTNGDKTKTNTMLWHLEKLVKNEILQAKTA